MKKDLFDICNTISFLRYVFWKVSTIFFHGYNSRICQKTRSIHSCGKLVNPHTASSHRASHKSPSTAGTWAASLPCQELWEPKSSQEPQDSVPTTTLCLEVFPGCLKALLSFSGISTRIIFPAKPYYPRSLFFKLQIFFVTSGNVTCFDPRAIVPSLGGPEQPAAVPPPHLSLPRARGIWGRHGGGCEKYQM